MALKPFIYEFCKRCGQKDAEVRGDFIWRGIHSCAKPIPGPGNYPQRFALKNVVFIQAREEDSVNG
jgi:hypothetical protein